MKRQKDIVVSGHEIKGHLMPTAVPFNIEKVKKISRGMGELILICWNWACKVVLVLLWTTPMYLSTTSIWASSQFFLPYNIFTQINSFLAGACGVKTSESISVSFFEVFVTVMTLNQNYTNVFVVSVFEDTKM